MMARRLYTLVNLLIFNLLTKYATGSLSAYGARFLIALPKVDILQKEKIHFLLGTMANKIQFTPNRDDRFHGQQQVWKRRFHQVSEEDMRRILRETLEKEREKDRKCWREEMSALKETILADRQYLMDQFLKNADAEKKMFHTYCSIDENQDTQSSLQKADESSLLNGTTETQVLEGGIKDAEKYARLCQKNKGHQEFKGVNDFNISHLPNEFKDIELVDFIKATANLTVRVDVAMTSKKNWGNTHGQSVINDMRQSNVLRVGTGMVCDVENQTEGMIKALKRGDCNCQTCQSSGTPSKVWGVVKVILSTEVVSGEAEAIQTTCRLFYDEQTSPAATLGGWKVEEANPEKGWMVLKCVTCDIALLDKLDWMWKNWRYNLLYKVNNKFRESRGKLAIIVSHPHGYRKKISVGKLIKRYDVGDGWVKHTYTTCTCPGSSGAYVHLIGSSDWNYGSHIVHSGVNSEGINFSCASVKVD